jgi:tetratricopeptide (TPR) repeat protein
LARPTPGIKAARSFSNSFKLLEGDQTMKHATTALGLVLGFSAASASAQYGAMPPPQLPRPNPPQEQQQKQQPAEPQAANSVRPSQKALKAIIDLQTAVNANDAANIPAKVAAANAVATTKEDRYLIGQLQLKAALASKDSAATSAAIDAIAKSGYADANNVSQLYMALGSQYYNAKQFDQASAAFEHGLAVNPNNTDLLLNLGETRFAQGRKADAIAVFQKAIQARTAAGQKPEEALYKRALGIAYDAQMPTAAELGRQWVAAYPSPQSWRDAIAVYRNMTKPDVEGTVALLRLMQATGALSQPADYNLYATAVAEQSNYNEAQAVLDAGIAAGQVDPKSALFRDTIAGLKAKPKATAADLAAATKTAQSGMALLRIGDRYYAMGQYDKAVDLYKMSMGKAGVDNNLANLHIGMALARAGDKAGATAALNAVTGPRAEIAKYWLLYVQQKA